MSCLYFSMYQHGVSKYVYSVPLTIMCFQFTIGVIDVVFYSKQTAVIITNGSLHFYVNQPTGSIKKEQGFIPGSSLNNNTILYFLSYMERTLKLKSKYKIKFNVTNM